MKTYEVELEYTAYMVVTVEAENEEHAEDLAWEEIVKDGSDKRGGDWRVESVEEIFS
jgi:hypothetical protein